MDEYYLVEDDIINKQYYEKIKDMINCIICLNIIEDPVQCDICHHFYCSECIKKLSRCPMGCQNYKIIPGIYCKELLSGIIIRCECGLELNYNNIKKHKEEECQNIDFKERYLNLRQKYGLLLEEKDYRKTLKENSGAIKIAEHKHPLNIMRHFKNSWSCDICNNTFSNDIPSYNCTLCDYDICYNCVKDKIIKGVIHNEMKNYY